MRNHGAPRRYVLDAGALIAQERGDVKVAAIFKVAAAQRIEMVLPSVVLAQVWRNGARQVQLARTLSNPGVTEAPLHHEDAKRVGELLRESATTDVADAHVAVLAARLGAAVITSDAGDITKLNPALPVVQV
ncbi:MAG TPA: PIN domain-containing protein [Trebonia sp.]|nr:PIN domain-containing protein [Trebonia sp.]